MEAAPGSTRSARPERPKPFLPLLEHGSLLQASVARLAGLTDDVTIVADRRYESLVREQAPDAHLLLEPLGRNTAAAIALAALAIDRPEDEVMVVVAADQTVEDVAGFRRVLETACEHLATGAFGIDDPLVTLGIRVDGPAVEYGYLIPDVASGEDIDGTRAYPLLRFEEKPKPARAEELLDMPGVAWNAGIFVWRLIVVTGPALRAAGAHPGPGCPGPGRAGGPQHRRRDRPGHRRHRPPRRRGHARPPGRPRRGARGRLPGDPSDRRGAPGDRRRARRRRPARHPRHPGHPPGDEYGYLIPRVEARTVVDGVTAYPLRTFEEKPKPARAVELAKEEGVAWNAGMFLWRRRSIRAEPERYTGLIRRSTR